MVTYVPGFGEQLAPAMAQIASALQQIIDPNKGLREAVQTAVAKDPTLLQSLADANARTPGILRALGLGSVGDAISSVPESTAATIERKTSKQRVAQAETQTVINTDVLNKALELVQSGDPTSIEAAAKLLGSLTPTERRLQGAQADVAESKARVQAAAEPAQIKAAQLDYTDQTIREQVLNNAVKNIEGLGTINFQDVAKDMLAGKQPKNLLQIMSIPEARTALQQSLNALEFQRRDATDRYRMSLGSDNFWLQSAFNMYRTTGGSGSLQAWMSYLADPEVRKKAADLSEQDRNSLNTNERDLVDVANSVDVMDAKARSTQALSINRGITAQEAVIAEAIDHGEDISTIQRHVSDLNDLLQSKSVYTGRLYTAHYGDIPGSGKGLFHFTRTDLYYTDENGNVVPDTEPLIIGANSTTKQVVDANIMRATAQITSLPEGQWTEALDSLQANNPELYKRVKPNIDSLRKNPQ